MEFLKKRFLVWIAVGAAVLPVPAVLAAIGPVDGQDSIDLALPERSGRTARTSCPSFVPLANTIEPTVPAGEKDPPDRPNSNCAGDLGGIEAPVVQASPEPVSVPSDAPPEISPAGPVETGGWRLDFQPYITVPITTYGQVEIRGRTVNYHVDTGQLLDVLKVAVSGRVEAWNGNLGLIFDGYYVNLGGSGIVGAKRPEVEGTLESTLSFDQGIYDFAVSYHLGDRAVPYNPNEPSTERFPRVWFAPYVGTRLNDINSTIDTTLNLPRPGIVGQDSVSRGRTWFEPLVGGKLGVQISEPIAFWLRGDASGFDLAGDTDMSWNLIFGMDWWVRRQISLQFAYRFYGIDYGNGSGNNAFRFQENFNGPYLSATFRF